MDTEKITYSPLPNYGDHMELDHFIACCKSSCFIDSDGSGCYATADKITNITVHPSDITGKYSEFNFETHEYIPRTCKIDIRKEFSHVVWFNK